MIKIRQLKPVMFYWLIFAVRAAGKVIGWSGVQAILIKRFGITSLPYSYMLFSIFGMIGAFLYLFFADAVRRERLLKIYCFFTGFTLILSLLFIPASSQETIRLVIFLLLILSAHCLGDSTLGMQIWTMINDNFRPTQGVLFYPIIATSSLVGRIIGGFFLSSLKGLPTGIFILIWGLSVVALPFIILQFQKYPKEEEEKKVKNLKDSWAHLKDGYYFVMRTRFVKVLALICVLFWLVASLKEFPYNRILNIQFPLEKELVSYYGYYNILINVSVLIFQVFFTSQVIKIIGAPSGLYVLPVIISSGIISVWISRTFLVAFSMRFSWDIIAMTLQGSAYQLVYHCIPSEYRGRVRALLEGFMNTLGGFLGGAILVSVQNEPFIICLVISFSIIWLFVAITLKKYYYMTAVQGLNSEDNKTYLDAIEIIRQAPNAVKKRIRMNEAASQRHFEEHEREKFSIVEVSDIIHEQTVLNQTGSISFSYTDDIEIDLVLDNEHWKIFDKTNKLKILRRDKTIQNFSMLQKGRIYWENEVGYIQILWRYKKIDKVEIGNYAKHSITKIKISSYNEIKIKKNNKIDPFSKFVVEIKPRGYKIN